MAPHDIKTATDESPIQDVDAETAERRREQGREQERQEYEMWLETGPHTTTEVDVEWHQARMERDAEIAERRDAERRRDNIQDSDADVMSDEDVDNQFADFIRRLAQEDTA